MSIPMIDDYKFRFCCYCGGSLVVVIPRFCPGTDDDDCGDEVDSDATHCPAHQRELNAAADREGRERDGGEELVSYPSLTSPEEHLQLKEGHNYEI